MTQKDFRRSMSPRQYTLMGQLVNAPVTLDDAYKLNQTTFGACLHNGWFKYDRKAQQFAVTDIGRQAFYGYGTQDILRRVERATLTRWFPLNGKAAGR